MPAGRTCAGEGCGTRLSVYNRGELCSVCDRSPATVIGRPAAR